MARCFVAVALLAVSWLVSGTSNSHAAPCFMVTLTGTQGGPQSFNGLAGAGTLVRFGDDADECGAVKLQFDAGRGTTMRLSQLKVGPEQLDAVFFTHMHNDHTEGFADLVQLRWSFNGTGPKIDVVCSADSVSPTGVTISCSKFTAHIADAFIQSGEPASVVAIVDDYGRWLADSPIPKLFINAEPGSILTDAVRDFCRTWPNQKEITVKGTHFIQEDSPHEIGRAVADFARSVRDGTFAGE
jgi:ribonuclease BN (tRNA processing enzyme)